MLLRSSSAPIPSSLLPSSNEFSSPEPTEQILHISRTVSDVAKTDPQTPPKPEKKNCVSCSNVLKNQQQSVIKVKESDGVEESKQKNHKKVGKLQTSTMGCGMGGSDGGIICGGGGGRGSDDGHGSWWDFFSEENNHGRDGTDAYYQNMIEANPNNPLLLGNYAKFLKEVCGDYSKAEEYLERAILVNPGDANVLSLYADLIWQKEKNADRAEGYFDQAVQSAPDDCYVLASYAKFLWDVEEDEDKECHYKDDQSYTYPADLLRGTNGRPHVAAASQPSLFASE